MQVPSYHGENSDVFLSAAGTIYLAAMGLVLQLLFTFDFAKAPIACATASNLLQPRHAAHRRYHFSCIWLD